MTNGILAGECSEVRRESEARNITIFVGTLGQGIWRSTDGPTFKDTLMQMKGLPG